MAWYNPLSWRTTPKHILIKESAAAPLVQIQLLGRPVWTPRMYDDLARQSYVMNSIAYRCVRLITMGASEVPLLAYKDRKKQTEFEDHPVLELMDAPNPAMSGVEFMEALYSFLCLAGNSYMEGVTVGQKLVELYCLRPDRMKVIPGPSGWPEGYEYTVGQTRTRFKMERQGTQQPILHLKDFHPTNDHYGLSAVEAAAFNIDVHNSAGAYNKALLDNSARPSGALVYSGGKDGTARMGEDEYNRLKAEIEEKYTGQQNAGRPLFLEGGLSWNEMGTTPQDMQFIQTKSAAAREIALSFGVPPLLLGIPGDNTYANYQEANRAFYRQTILPLVARVALSISIFVRPSFGDVYLAPDKDEVVALSEERKEVWDKVAAADWLTVNEKREATGYETLGEEGDVVLTPSTSIPLTDQGLDEGGAAEDDEETEETPTGDPAEQEAE